MPYSVRSLESETAGALAGSHSQRAPSNDSTDRLTRQEDSDDDLARFTKLGRTAALTPQSPAAPEERKPELILVSDGPISLGSGSTTVTLHPPGQSSSPPATPEEHKPELILVSDGPISLGSGSTTVTLHPPGAPPRA